MSLTSLPSSFQQLVREIPCNRRAFHSSSTARASILFALGALSNSRETAHFNKITKLPRWEHSPNLKIIKTSEVDTYPSPTPSKMIAKSSAYAWTSSRTSSALRIWDDKALKVGRTVLANEARKSRKLSHAFARIKRRQAAQDKLITKERVAWHRERLRLERDMRTAVKWILVSIGAATAIAAWKFFPGVAPPRSEVDMGRKIAARAAAAMPLPAAVIREPISVPVAHESKVVAPASTTAFATKQTSTSPTIKHGWLQGWFWRP